MLGRGKMIVTIDLSNPRYDVIAEQMRDTALAGDPLTFIVHATLEHPNPMTIHGKVSKPITTRINPQEEDDGNDDEG